MDRSSVGAGAIARGSGLGGARERAAASASDGCGALATRRAEAHLNANSALISAGEESKAGAPRPRGLISAGRGRRCAARRFPLRGVRRGAAHINGSAIQNRASRRTVEIRTPDIISPTIFEGMGPNARESATARRRVAQSTRRPTRATSNMAAQSVIALAPVAPLRVDRARDASTSGRAFAPSRERRVGGGVVIPARGRAVPTWRACHRCVQRTFSATPARLVPSRPLEAPRCAPENAEDARATDDAEGVPTPSTKPDDDSDDSDDADDPATRVALALIRFYRTQISPLTPPSCRFVPTCSQYGMTAFRKFGPAKGFVLTAWRILRCNPRGGRGYDPPAWPPVGLGGTAAPDDY